MEYTKVCKCCHKTFISSSRNTRYCSVSCQQKKYNILKQNRKAYDENKLHLRIKAQAHQLAVNVLKVYYLEQGMPWVCSECGSVTSLEVHHKNVQPLDNRLENLTLLCKVCHSKEHSRISKIK